MEAVMMWLGRLWLRFAAAVLCPIFGHDEAPPVWIGPNHRGHECRRCMAGWITVRYLAHWIKVQKP